MEKLIEIFNKGSGLNLEQGDVVVLFDSKTEKTVVTGRSNAENMVKDIHETVKMALEKAGIETRE
ncbi:MAG: hypothetical protein PHE32_01250 [Candidatus Shapirobacteria bacterium]|nr:hypothetical protein [Candidatus Shapirobacteria bacterium]